MIPKPFIPCEDFSELLRAINNGKQISIVKLPRLHFHLLECNDCRLLLNDNGRKTLYGEEYEEQITKIIYKTNNIGLKDL